MKNQKDLLEAIKKTVLAFDREAEVILFGSRARGDFKIESDWDILVLTEKKADSIFQRKLRDQITDIELAYTTPLSTIIINKAEWKKSEVNPFYKNVIAEGKRI